MDKDCMTPQMWELYRLIEEYTKNGKELRTETIAKKIPYYQSSSPRSPKIYDDVFLINTAYAYQHDKYIITNHNRFKLATKAEIKKEYIKVASKYVKLNKIVKTLRRLVERDGNYKLLSNDNKPIDESKGKKYIESYAER